MVEKYIIDKSDIHKLLTGQDITLDNGSKARAFLIEIQGNPANGDMILTTFPSAKIRWISQSHIGVTFMDNQYYITEFELDWWNAPFKAESEE